MDVKELDKIDVGEEETEFSCETSDERFLPDGDYNKKGKVRTMRARIMKKLMKYEFKALLPPTLLLIGATMILGIFLGLEYRFVNPDTPSGQRALSFALILTIFFYIANFAIAILPVAISGGRFSKYFFSGEGYLTLSLPVSAEEHIWAKHFSAIATGVISVVSIILINIVYLLISGRSIDLSFDYPAGANGFFTAVWNAIIAVIWFVNVYLLVGAGACFSMRNKRKLVLKIILIYLICSILFGFLEMIISFVLISGTFDGPADYVTWHVGKFILTAISLLFTILAYFYERRALKTDLNL